MDQGLSLKWTQGEASRKGSAYRTLFWIALLIDAALGLAALIVPLWLAGLLGGSPGPDGPVPDAFGDWVRAWGCLVLVWTLVQLPAPGDAPRRRWLNGVAAAGRGVLALAYALIGFTWLALLQAVLALLLAFTLYRFAMAVLMSRP